MKNKLSAALLVVVLALLAASGLLWRNGQRAADEARLRAVKTLLEPVQALLEQNRVQLEQLRATQADKGGDVLESYLAKIRREGVPANAGSRQLLDQVAVNNVAIVTLLTAYGPHARTPALQREVDRFREHAASWQRRWGSVMEVFMAGGTFAAPLAAFPAELPDRLKDELAAQR